ncbi:MAG: hypothetical protein IJ641_05785, partial [Lachnospiraceae bacterium]|nr:hypothetical protein [Lachnospiraceae bacterium]
TVPANDDAGVLDVKSGRRNRKSDEDTIKQIISLANSLLDSEDDDNAEDDPDGNPAGEDSKGVNADKKQELLDMIKNMEDQKNEH